MCCGCWQEDGSPRIDNERVRSVLPLIQEVYKHSAVGGNLHCVLDDNNLDDEFLESSLEEIAKGGYRRPEAHKTILGEDEPDSPAQLTAERICAETLLAMTYEERVSALGLADGCWQ